MLEHPSKIFDVSSLHKYNTLTDIVGLSSTPVTSMSQWLNDEAFSRGRATLPKVGIALMNGVKQPVSFTRSEPHVNALPMPPAKTAGSTVDIQSVSGPVPNKTSSKVQTGIRRLLQMKADNEERLQQMKVQTQMLALGKTDKRSNFNKDYTERKQSLDIYHTILKTAHSTAEPTITTFVQETSDVRIEQESSERYQLSGKSLDNENDLVKTILVFPLTPKKELFIAQDESNLPAEGSDIPQTCANHICYSLRDNETAVHKVNAICQLLDRIVEKEIQSLVETTTGTYDLSGIEGLPRSETSENFKNAFLKQIAMSQKLIYGETLKNEVNIVKKKLFSDINLKNSSPRADEAKVDNSENGPFLDSREVDCLIKDKFAAKKVETPSSLRNDVCRTSKNLASPKDNTAEKKHEHLLNISNRVCEMIDDEKVFAMKVYGKFSESDSLPRELTAAEKVEAFLAHTDCVESSRRNASSKEETAINNLTPAAVNSKKYGSPTASKPRYEEEIDNMKIHFESSDSDSSPRELTAAEKLEAFLVHQGQVCRSSQNGSLPREETSKINLSRRDVSSEKEGCFTEGMLRGSKAIQDSIKKKRMSSIDPAKSISTIEQAPIKQDEEMKKVPHTVSMTTASNLRYEEEFDNMKIHFESSDCDYSLRELTVAEKVEALLASTSCVCRSAQHQSTAKEGTRETIVSNSSNRKEDCISEGIAHASKAVQESTRKKQVYISNATMSDSTQGDLSQKEEAEMKQISPIAPKTTVSKLRYEEEIDNRKIEYESSESDNSPRELTASAEVEVYSKSLVSDCRKAKTPTVSWLTPEEETSASEDKNKPFLEGLDEHQTPTRHRTARIRDTTPAVVNTLGLNNIKDVNIIVDSFGAYSCPKVNGQSCIASPKEKLEALANCTKEEYADDFEEESEEGECSESYEGSETSDEYFHGNRTAFERQKAENPAWVRPLLLPINPYSFILLSRYSDTSYKSLKDRLGVKGFFQSRPSVVEQGPVRVLC